MEPQIVNNNNKKSIKSNGTEQSMIQEKCSNANSDEQAG